MKFFTQFSGVCLFFAWQSTLLAQVFLPLTESPANQNLFVADLSESFTGTGVGNGISRAFNASAEDRLSAIIETARQDNSTPLIRLTDAASNVLITVTGDARGRARLQNFRIPSPGVYTLAFYSNSNPSAFDAQVLLSRGFQLESEQNNLAPSANSYSSTATGASFTLSAAGLLNGDPDWIDLGNLASGQSLNFTLDQPSTSTLDLSTVRLSLWRDGDLSPQATAIGASLNHNLTASGRYRIEIALPGPGGKHLLFTGDGDHVNLGTPTALQITGSQTIEFWIKPDRLGVRQNPYEKAYGGEGTITLEPSGDLNFYYGKNGGNGGNFQGVNSLARLRSEEWSHLAIVRDFTSDPQKVRWYFNGKLTQEVDATYFPATAGTRDFLLGTGYAGAFAGALDEFRIWNVARSAAEIQTGMTSTPALNTPGLVAAYSFEEGSGTTISDSSGNGLDGTISGNLDWIAGTNDLAAFNTQGIRGVWFAQAQISDTTLPSVTQAELIPLNGYTFDGTSPAPANMTAERGNNGSEFLFTVIGSNSGTLKGTGLYTDDSSVARAAVHAGILKPGESGAVRVTIAPGAERYPASPAFGNQSSYSGAFPGSFTIERYEPASPFSLTALYTRLWVRLSEEVDPETLSNGLTLTDPGADGLIGTADDEVLPTSLESTGDGDRYLFNFGGRILTAGIHRLEIASTVADRAANTMTAPFSQDFEIVSDNLSNESGDNNTFATADSLSFTPQPGTFDNSFLDYGINQSSVGQNPRDLITADLDGDGNLDAAVGYAGNGDKISLFPGNGDGTFDTPLEFSAGGDVWGLELIDFNKDGLLDIVAAARSLDALILLRNTSTPGTLAFTAEANLTVGDDPLNIVVADFNGDTWPDLAVSNYGTNATTGRSLTLLLNDQAGGFTFSTLEQGNLRPYGLTAADFNGDNHPDLAIGDIENSGRIAVLLGNGNGTFGALASYPFPVNWSASEIIPADYNQDGHLDLAVTRAVANSQELSIYPGIGDGTFDERVQLNIGSNWEIYHAKGDDYTGDGWPDLLIAGYRTVMVLQNRADGTFGFRVSRLLADNAFTYGADFGDFDGDGTPDILATDDNDDLLRLINGNPNLPLAENDTNPATGLQHGFGRGFLSDNTDLDNFKFTARAGQIVSLSSDTQNLSGTTRLRYLLYDPRGNILLDVQGGTVNNSQTTIPRDGTYFVRVQPWNGDYNTEYRFRVTLGPVGSGQMESETNDQISQADGLALTLNGNQLTNRIYGLIDSQDTNGDYFGLGNIAAGTQVDITIDLPTTSTLTDYTLGLYRNSNSATPIATSNNAPLSYLLQPGDEDTYSMRITGTDRGLLSEYFLNTTLSDTTPPFVTNLTLPAEGTNLPFFGSRFSIGYSEDMLPPTVTNPAHFELLASGGDGTFDDGNEIPYLVTPDNYSSGLSQGLTLSENPLQPDDYRFTVTTNLRDKLDNPLAAPFIRLFTIDPVPGVVSEDRDNNTFATADSLSFTPQPGTFDNSFLDYGINQSSVGQNPRDLITADLDGDGNLDAAVGYAGNGDKISLFPGNGDGTFDTPLEFSAGGDVWGLELIDFNKDGLLDIVAAARSLDALILLRNTSTPGTLAFTAEANLTVGDDPLNIVVADFNGDTWPDLAVSNYGTNATTGRSLTLLLNDQAGGFTFSTLEQGNLRPYGLTAADFNGDNHPDLAIGDIENSGRIAVLLGNGNGTFGALASYPFPVNWSASEIIPADYNQDGHLDLAVTRAVANSQELSIYPGIGDGTFDERVQLNIGSNWEIYHAKGDDYTGDGWPDLLIAGYRTVMVLQNRADGTFGFRVSRLLADNAFTYGADFGDFDGDGTPDILATDDNDDLLRLINGNPNLPLAENDTNPATGLQHGFGRGFLSDNTDLDNFKFTARAGQIVSLSSDTQNLSGTTRLRYLLYDPRGNILLDVQGGTVNNSQTTIPRDGTYFVRVQPWNGDYNTEYRFRVTLGPVGSGQMESETNDQISQADGLALTLNGNQLTNRIYGLIDSQDTNGDYFGLGNIAAGTQVDITIDLPTTSTLTDYTLGLYRNSNSATPIATSNNAPLSYLLQPGDEDTYSMRITGTDRGLLSEYFLNTTLSDTTPPFVTNLTLPAEGTNLPFFGSRFSIGYSEDMLPPTVTNPAHFELLASGGDGTFDDGNEIPYLVTPDNYSSGLSQGLTLSENPLQPDDYRFTVTTNLRDKLDNPLAAPFIRLFTIDPVPGVVSEDRDNNTFATADSLSFTPQPGTFDNSFLDYGINQSSVGQNPRDLITADLDGDGNLDAAVGYAGNGDKISLFPGNGDGTFDTPLEFSAGGDVWGLELIDFNKDGLLDIVAAARSLDALILLRNTSTPGTLAFTAEANLTVGDDPLNIVVADFNGDTWPDLAVSNYGTNATTGRSLTLLLNDQAGGFTFSTLEQGNLRPYGLTAADFNGDNHPDLAIGDIENSGRIAVLLGNGNGTFGALASYPFPVNWSASEIIPADYNQDGHLDLAVTRAVANSQELSIYPGIGDGTFDERVQLNIGSNWEIYHAKGDDYTGDGWPDLLIAGYRTVMVLQNRADGTFGFRVSRLLADNAFTYGADFGDFDGDGTPDILATDDNDDLLRLINGNPNLPLAENDTNPATGLQHGFGRGFLSDNTDLDNFKFTARAGQIVSLSSDTQNLSGTTRLRYLLYDPRGNILLDVQGGTVNNSQTTIPRDGTYFVRVQPWNGDYNTEYRFRVTLGPVGSGQMESETNDQISQADGLALTLNGNQLTNRIYGLIDSQDTNGDYFGLGNLSASTEVRIRLDLPTTSTLGSYTLRLLRSDNSVVATSTDAELVHTIPNGEDDSYFYRLTSGGSGLLAEYFANVSITDLLPPSILADTLPDPSSPNLVSSFSLTFNKDMAAPTVTNPANYSLVWDGPDGLPATVDDLAFPIVPSSYSNGLTASYSISDSPLPTGTYQLRINGLADVFGNTLPVPYERTFTIVGPSEFQTEREANNNIASANLLILNEDHPGYCTANGRGILTNSDNNDYWAFDAVAGERLVLESFLPGNNSRIRFFLYDPDDLQILDINPNNSDLESRAPLVLTKSGRYKLRVTDWNSIRSEYRFRTSLIGSEIDYESEDNGSIPVANPLTFNVVNNINTATVGGFIGQPTQLDYFDLGTIGAGNTVFLSVRKPEGSILNPIVGLYNSSGILVNEISGNIGDENAEVRVTATGNYTALIRANLGTSGLNGDYLLDVRTLPTNEVNFPNLQVTRLDNIAPTGLASGDSFNVSFDVTNTGSLATGAANWTDRVVLSTNDLYGDGDDLQLAVIPHSGALNPAGDYTVNQSVTLPNGLVGNFFLIVTTDSANSVDEILQEGDNARATTATFNVELQAYPDLVVENLVISAPDASGNYDLTWNLANRGTGVAPIGHRTKLRVINTANSQVIFNQDFTVSQLINPDEFISQNQTITTTAPGFYLVTLEADTFAEVYEFGSSGHGPAEQNSVQGNFQIFNFYDIAVAASPETGGSVTGGGNFREGIEATVTATPDTSVLPYRFINWTENNQFVSASPTYTFTVNNDRNLVAVFGLPQYQITATTVPVIGGSVTGTGTYELNSTANLTANPAPGYLFDFWESNSLNIGNANPLSVPVSENRSFIARFIEANPEHLVTLETSPPGLAVIPGGGTYTNGQTLNTTAPASIESGDSEYLFEKFLLNGVHLNTNRVLQKTFSTVDPGTMAYTAAYTQRSLRPILTVVTTNYGTLVPGADNVTFTLTFDRDMNQTIIPQLTLASATAQTIPPVGGGAWSGPRTFVSGPTDFSGDSSGAFTLTVASATDTNARVMDPDSTFAFTVDILPPQNPTLTLANTTSSTATVTWNDYSAPGDLKSFRYYLATTSFTDASALVAVNGAGLNARSYTFRNLTPDTDYYVAVVAQDFAGNSNPEVTPLTFRLETQLPPAVTPVLTRPTINSAHLDWTAYDRNLVGLEGFRVYRSETPFTDVSPLSPVAELPATTTSFLLEGLDRTKTYHLAVVAYNRNDEQIDTVTPAIWTDPLGGTLSENFTIGGPQASIPIHQNLTLSGGATLTLLPGTTLTFAENTSLSVDNGSLIAEGTALLPIHLTSAGEFTNPPTAVRGSWGGLSLNSGTSSLRHLWLRFGSGLQLTSGSTTLNNFYAVQNSEAGLKVSGNANLTATACYLAYNELGASTSGNGSLNLSQSILKSNTTGNASQSESSTLTAPNNWWGNSTPSGLSGTIDSSSPLANEPILGAAFAVKENLTQTASREIALVINSANAIGFRFSENSAFPSALFENLFEADDDFRVSPYGFEMPFTLSPGAGLKTLFAQLRSETDTTSSTLSTQISLITDGPVVQTFSLAEGTEVGRPLNVTATATAPLGLQRLDFLVNGQLIARSVTSPLNILWDPRSLPQGLARAQILAVDQFGSATTRSVNIVLAPRAPDQPVILDPTSGLVTNSSPITVTGTAEPSVDLTLTRNGQVVSTTTQAALNGQFSFTNVPLNEGNNNLVVTATDLIGSSSSLPTTVVFDSGPPAAPILASIERENRGLLIDWSFQGSETPTSYRVYWNATSFTNPDTATGTSDPVTTTGGNFTIPDGNWFIGVAAFDGAGNRSPISNLIQTTVDFTPPTLTVSYDKSNPVGKGPLSLQITSSEPLQTPPSLTIRSQGSSSRISVTLTQQEATRFSGTYVVDSQFSRSGTATVRVSARDLAGNVLTNATPQGPALIFDVTNPTAEIIVAQATPIQTTSPQNISVGLTLSEPLQAGTTPVLEFEPPVGNNVAITLSGSGTSWSGQFTVNAAMGNGDGFFRFSGTDPAGNNGSTVTSGGTLELYNTSTPPPPAVPPQIAGQILPGGQIRITWSAVERAESYKVFRETGSEGGTPTLLIESGITELSYTDLPPVDGLYRYAVVASLRGADGPPSGVLVAESDRVPPEPATNFTAQLAARGVQISFSAPASGGAPVKYRIYRGSTLIREYNTPASHTDFPPRGSHDYSVATVDQYGNENPSAPITINLLVSPVTDLQLHAKQGSANSLTWTNTDNTVVGYNLYRNGVKQNGAALPIAAFVDPLGLGGRSVTYEVSAVNAGGDESPRRLLTVFPLGLKGFLNRDELGREGSSFIGYFDNLQLDISNLSDSDSINLEEIQINRTVTGQDDLSQSSSLSLEIPAGTTTTSAVVVPAPLTAGLAQTFQVILASSADNSGARVTYEFNFTKAVARSGTQTASIVTTEIPVAGANASVEVTLQNLGGASMDVVLGRTGGLNPGDLAIVVRDDNDTIVSRQEFNGFGVQGLITFPNGDLVARIPAGQTITFTVPDILVPNSLGEQGLGATFAIEIANLYSQYGSALQTSQTSLIRATAFSSLIETPYFANLTTDQDRYSNEDDIIITGQAINRSTGLPEPNAPLRIGFGIRNYVLYQEVTTDNNGDYLFTYRPPQGFGGSINLWAAHPLIVDQLNQKTIEYRRFYVIPGSGQIVMSKNDTLEFSLKMVNPADLPLDNIQLSSRTFISEEGNEIDINSISYEILTPGPISLPPLGSTSIRLRATANIDAPDDAISVINLTSAENATATFKAYLSLRQPVPVLSFASPAVGYVDMAVNKGAIVSREVILENKGLRALEGVEVIPPSNLPWMDVNLPRNSSGQIVLPDIPVGGNLRFTVAYAPPESTPLGFYDDTLLIRGSNLQSDFQVNLFAQVTSAERGDVKFFVDNIFAEAVPNAKVRLRNPNLRQELGPFFTDSLGEITIPDLQEGGWSYQISASGHTTTSGVFDLTPGQTEFVDVRLSKSLVTVEFSVTPKPFTDRYEITIEQTFETRVPVPVLVMDPPLTQLYNLSGLTEGTILVDVKNEGLASLFQVVIEGQNAPNGSFIPLISYLPELKAQETVQIPFKYVIDYRDRESSSESGASPADLGSEEALNRLAKAYEVAAEIDKKTTLPETGNAGVDACAGIFLNPFPSATGLVALSAGVACCPDGAPMAGVAHSLLMGYSAASFATGIVGNLAAFVGCAIGSQFDLFGGSGPGGGSSSSSGPARGTGTFNGRGNGCFIAGTLVTMADGSFKPIEEITAGEMIKTGKNSTAPVEQMITRKNSNLFELTLQPLVFGDSSNQITLTGTADHYVWTDQSGWMRIDKLTPGDCLHRHNGKLYKLVQSKKVEGTHQVYTLMVTNDSVFYANKLLVEHLCGRFDEDETPTSAPSTTSEATTR